MWDAAETTSSLHFSEIFILDQLQPTPARIANHAPIPLAPTPSPR